MLARRHARIILYAVLSLSYDEQRIETHTYEKREQQVRSICEQYANVCYDVETSRHVRLPRQVNKKSISLKLHKKIILQKITLRKKRTLKIRTFTF